MFARRARGLLDLMMAALCIWAAYYRTPVGAIVRNVGAWVLGVRSTARPLLAYYSNGLYDAQRLAVPTYLVSGRAELSPSEALGYGAHLALLRLRVERRHSAEQFVRAHGVEPGKLLDTTSGPKEMARVLRDASRALGSEDAAVLALFCGEEISRYATDRARAEGRREILPELARQLPPGVEPEIGAASQALMFGTAYALAWPVGESIPVTSPFGMRDHPLLGERQMHTGVDLSMPVGSPVRAAQQGFVRRASEDDVNGKVLVIDHGRGVTTAYCHNSHLLVSSGDSVSKGQLISRSGNTGRSTGPHLHYQLDLGSVPVDPLAFRVKRGAIASGSGP